MSSSAFGLSLRFEPQPPGAWAPPPAAEPRMQVRAVGSEEVLERWSGLESTGWEATIDGAPFVAQRGQAGDHLFRHGEGSACYLSPDHAELLCAIDLAEPLAWRVVLDSVLFSVALIVGYEALHAGAVEIPSGALAITAGAGGGKSTLLAELLDGGLALFSDDVVVLEARGEAAPLAHPGAPLMTVPGSVDPLPGQPIAVINDEHWVAVPTAAAPLPLVGLVLLDRRPGLATALEGVGDPLALLLGSFLRFPRTAERERSRFEIAAAIAAHVTVLRLTAAPDVTPGELAELLRARFIS
jgi:hypothetical protein